MSTEAIELDALDARRRGPSNAAAPATLMAPMSATDQDLQQDQGRGPRRGGALSQTHHDDEDNSDAAAQEDRHNFSASSSTVYLSPTESEDLLVRPHFKMQDSFGTDTDDDTDGGRPSHHARLPDHLSRSPSRGVSLSMMTPPWPSRGGAGGARQKRNFREFMDVKRRDLRHILRFVGPGWLIAIGYLDPGNWAVDLEGGSKYGYSLLFVILVSNLMAVSLQHLCIKLGIVSGLDLAQACKAHYQKHTTWFLYALAEIAIIATDVAEVIGTAIALKLLSNGIIPLWAGVLITLADTIIILFGLQKKAKYLEWFIGALFAIVSICFVILMIESHPPITEILKGCIPHEVWNAEMIYLASSILGATVMPHNLYLHSSIVQERATQVTSRRKAIKYAFIDLCSSLVFALFVNASILIIAAANFHAKGQTDIATIENAHALLAESLGPGAAVVFALALFFSGQSSTITGTLTGQIVMEGFVDLKVQPWLRRLLTRLLAVVPAVIITWIYGARGSNQLLVMSQVILSIQLPFAIIPLIHLNRNIHLMGATYRLRGWPYYLAIALACFVILLNISMVIMGIKEAT